MDAYVGPLLTLHEISTFAGILGYASMVAKLLKHHISSTNLRYFTPPPSIPKDPAVDRWGAAPGDLILVHVQVTFN